MARGRIVYFSRQPIAHGEELTLDYKYNSRLDPMPCHCGAPTCRGIMNLPRGHETRQPLPAVNRRSHENAKTRKTVWK